MSEQDEKRRKEELKQRIQGLLKSGTPRGVASWSYQRAKAFKDAVAMAQKAVASDRAKTEALMSTINTLESYYG